MADRTVLIPVHELYVEGPIDMGRVTVRPIDRATLDGWIEQASAEVPQGESLEPAITRWRTEMQGKAAVERRLRPERRRAVELARRDAESALALLTLFHPAMLHLGGDRHPRVSGAVKIDWVADLNDPLIRDYIDRARFERLLQSKGIKKDMTIVFYGDKNNRWATYGGAVHSYKAGDSFLEDNGCDPSLGIAADSFLPRERAE